MTTFYTYVQVTRLYPANAAPQGTAHFRTASCPRSQPGQVIRDGRDPAARLVITAMVETGDYLFVALDADAGVTAFRSEIGRNSLAGLKANLARIRTSITTEAQYDTAVAQFARTPPAPRTSAELGVPRPARRARSSRKPSRPQAGMNPLPRRV